MKSISKLLVIAAFFFLLMISFRLAHAQPNVPPTDGPWAQSKTNKGPGNNNGNGGGNGNGNGNSPCDNKNPPKWCTQNNVPIEGPQMLILMIGGVAVGSVAIKKMKIPVN